MSNSWAFCPLTRSITVQLKIEDASRRLRTGDLGIPLNPEDRFEKLLLQFNGKKFLLHLTYSIGFWIKDFHVDAIWRDFSHHWWSSRFGNLLLEKKTKTHTKKAVLKYLNYFLIRKSKQRNKSVVRTKPENRVKMFAVIILLTARSKYL